MCQRSSLRRICRCLAVLLVALLPGCGSGAPSPTAADGLTPDQRATLASLEKIDDFPFYTLHYTGAYDTGRTSLPPGAASSSPWACSLFAALGDPAQRIYGRNFDWEPSPVLLVFTHPPDGYASVSTVDLTFLGYTSETSQGLLRLPLAGRLALLHAPLLPFDGLNERGLAIGMAAVPSADMAPDPNKPAIGSIGVIREMLDHAGNVTEAVEILRSYNVDMAGGPPIHYLLADRSGQAALVEFHANEMHVIANDRPWHMATNFTRAAFEGSAAGECWRYDRLGQRLSAAEGKLDTPGALDLLSAVAQGHTQWSVAYDMTAGSLSIVVGRHFAKPPYSFRVD